MEDSFRKESRSRVYSLQVGKCFTVPVNPFMRLYFPTMDNNFVIASFWDRV